MRGSSPNGVADSFDPIMASFCPVPDLVACVIITYRSGLFIKMQKCIAVQVRSCPFAATEPPVAKWRAIGD